MFTPYIFFLIVLEVVYVGHNGDRCIYVGFLKERCIHLEMRPRYGSYNKKQIPGLSAVVFLSMGHYPYYRILDFIIIK